jgi:cell division protein FtsZ
MTRATRAAVSQEREVQIMLEFDEVQSPPGARIKVIGVGGGGGNAINTMIAEGLEGVEFIAVNTDMQALERNSAPLRLQLGSNLTRGLGAGANPDIGRDAALEDQARLAEVLEGADMVFVTAGMGGGTGTGAAPVIANVARELGALTVGVVTKPFTFEGARRRKFADQGLKALQDSVDTLITIPNQRLLAIAGNNTSLIDAFRRADEVLLHAVQGISDLITIGGLVNVDFADVKTIMSNMGMALMGTGRASGPSRARDAAEMAISSPLLEDVSINGATGILINITGGPDLALSEVSEASTLIQEAAHEDANIIFGTVIDEDMRDEIKLTVIATGFDKHLHQSQPQQNAYAQQPQHGYQQGPQHVAYGQQSQYGGYHNNYNQPQAPYEVRGAQANSYNQPQHNPYAAPQAPPQQKWGQNPYAPAPQAPPAQPQPAPQAQAAPPQAPAAQETVPAVALPPRATNPNIPALAQEARQPTISTVSSSSHVAARRPVTSEEDELEIPTFLRNKERNR